MKEIKIVIEDSCLCNESCNALVKTLKGYACCIFGDGTELYHYDRRFTSGSDIHRCQTCKDKISI